MMKEMNLLYRFALIVSLLLTVGAKHADTHGPDKCSIRFPNGFYCNSICEESKALKGNTVLCFLSNDGDYHRFVGRNPAAGTWRFYRVDDTTDENSLCKVSVKGDKLSLNKTDVICSGLKPAASSPDVSTKNSSTPEEKHDNSTSESEKRLSLKDLIFKINEEVSKLFKGKSATTEEPKEGAEPEAEEKEEEKAEARSAHRHALGRSESTKKPKTNEIPPADDICQLVTTEVCEETKMVYCSTNGKCCWANTDSKACKPESLKKYKECYKGLGAIMADAFY